MGADDYLTKPFHLSELNARLKSVIRRRNFGGNNEIVYFGMKVVCEPHRQISESEWERYYAYKKGI